MEAHFPHYDACAVKIEETAQPSRRMGQRATLCVLHGFTYYFVRRTLIICQRYKMAVGSYILIQFFHIYSNTWLNVLTTYMHMQIATYVSTNPQQNPQVSA